ncbi:MAG: hypothetical protein MUC49_07435 [Raineya sp.]|jgi:hypothetical protein|nr:hypothetical protein [Raineya sp.]
MKSLLFILFISCFVSCNDNIEPAYSRKVEILPYKNFKAITKAAQQQKQADSLKKLTLEYGIYYDKKYIPASVIQYLSQKYSDFESKSEWKIANPDEEVNLGCVVRDELPRRQLLALAKVDKYCIIYYLEGGEGVSREIMILSLDNNQVVKDTFFQEYKPIFMKTVKELSQKR